MSDDLVAFVNARLDEDEAIARAAYCEGPPSQQPTAPPEGAWWTVPQIMKGLGPGTWHDANHVARHDPARALREVDAKRMIIAAHAPYRFDGKGGEGDIRICAVCVSDKDDYAENWVMDEWPCLPARAIAAVYSGHPDYRPEWDLTAGR